MPEARTTRSQIAGRRWGSWSIAGTKTPIASSSIRSWGPAATSWSPTESLTRSNRLFLAFLAGLLVGAVGVVEELERQLQQPFGDSAISIGGRGGRASLVAC